ncbi:MAG TPA: sulfatase-like hydrolase/transferase [Planctomycetota bacterium]|nr:sulfatase-like hydrolase/transferase [Planctomycetota bacterium]
MLSTLLAFCVATSTGLHGQPPNVVVIYVDDLNSAWELQTVNAPNLRELAGRGVRFSRAYASHPLCAPSRIALLAGQRTLGTQVFSNGDDHPASPVNGVPYLPCALQAAGYHTAGVGKVFHDNQPQYWDEFHDFSDDPWVSQPVFVHVPASSTIVFGGPFLNGPDGSLGKLADTKRTEKARMLLAEGRQRLEATGQPFALWLGLEATHDPFVYPEKHLAEYDERDVPPLPEEEESDWKSAVAPAAYETGLVYDPEWGATEAEQRVQALLAYFRCISYIDELVGSVLTTLEQLGLEQNTIVVFVSDHGLSFSEHAHIGKTTGFDEDSVAPLVIAVPQLVATHGQTVETPVSQVDLYPTLMELLELPAADGLDGASLVPLLQDVGAPHPPVFYTTDEEWGFNLTRYVVKRDAVTGGLWKLGAWEHDDTIPQLNQLYDLDADPGEYVNRYQELAAGAKVKELRRDLELVGLLGPSSRSFGTSVAGRLGAPALTWSGVARPGGAGTLVIGNSSGGDTLGLLAVGLSGNYAWSPKAFSIKPLLGVFVVIPEAGLSIPAVLPSGPGSHELPIGAQLLQADSGSPAGLSRSRGLSPFLSD